MPLLIWLGENNAMCEKCADLQFSLSFDNGNQLATEKRTSCMQNFEITIIVLGILIALLAVADKLRLPNPVILVIAGLSLGFIPSLPSLVLNPEVVFLLFLPPILYDTASNTSWHDFRSEIKPIATLAIALVFFTTVSVAIACYTLIPGFTWPLAFVLGAIVSPPDAVAATGIIKGLGLNKRVITILEGESLVNDASALIGYRFAIAAIATGSFVLWNAALNFLLIVIGGVVVGTCIGYLLVVLHKRILSHSIISTSLTLLTPFISYLAAERLHTSGVLAVVSTGLIMSWKAPEIFSFQTRIRNRAVWDTLIFLLNGFIFILIGLQLPSILTDLAQYALSDLVYYGLIIGGVTITVRMLWVFAAAYSPIARSRKKSTGPGDDGSTWKNVLIVAWTGTRGVVSLATALALPMTLNNDAIFPQRSLILFLAFVVIFMTLVVQGLSLPILIKMLGIKIRPDAHHEELELRLLMANGVIDFIQSDLPLAGNEQLKTQLKNHYIGKRDFLSKESAVRSEEHSSGSPKPAESPALSAKKEIHKFQRKLLIGFHKDGFFSQSAIRRLEQELDHEEQQLARYKKKNR